MLRNETGDLFDSGIKDLAHGVNIRGVMGAGIAAAFRSRYPEMYQMYVHACSQGTLLPGDCLMYHSSADERMIFNLATQVEPGADARLDLVILSVFSMMNEAESYGIPAIGMPRIGCGIGGLDWDTQVEPALKALTTIIPEVDLVVYTL